SLVSSIRLRPPRYALFPDTTLFRSMLAAVARRLPADAAFSGLTAAWLHGLDMAPCDPIEVTIPEPIGSNRRAGASVRRAALCLRSEEHTSELQSPDHLVCRLLLETK